MLLSVAAHFAQSPEDYDAARKSIDTVLARHGKIGATRTTLTLNLAAGCLRTTRGQYDDAIPFFTSAMLAAQGLGHMNALARSCSNLSMCYGRLGQYEAQLAMANSGIRALVGLTDLVWFQLESHAAWANAMLGDASNSLALIKESRQDRRPILPTWAQQGRLLLRSDVYRILGREDLSFRLAKLATTQAYERLISRSFAGPFARAIAQISLEEVCIQEGLSRIAAILRGTELDAIDFAEVLCAEIAMKLAIGQDCTAAKALLARRLCGLPAETPRALGRLGFAIALECAAGTPERNVLAQHPL